MQTDAAAHIRHDPLQKLYRIHKFDPQDQRLVLANWANI